MLDPNLLLQYRYSETKEDHGKRTGYEVQLSYYIGLHIKDAELLLKIRSFFNGVGNIYYDYNKNIIHFIVKNSKEINDIIIPHFKKYPLNSQKQIDFLLFQSIFELINKKQHLSMDDFINILKLKIFHNKGLKPEFIELLKINGINIKLEQESLISSTKSKRTKNFIQEELNPYWIAGFVSGDGSFNVSISKSKTKLGFTLAPSFSVNLHQREEDLITNLFKYFNCGTITKNEIAIKVQFRVRSLLPILNIILPFFSTYKIEGIKKLDFEDFFKIVQLIKNQEHLTEKGLNQIREIISNMNQRRIIKDFSS